MTNEADTCRDIYFRSPEVWPQLSGQSGGTNVRRRRLNPQDFLNLEMPWPSEATQRAIRDTVERPSEITNPQNGNRRRAGRRASRNPRQGSRESCDVMAADNGNTLGRDQIMKDRDFIRFDKIDPALQPLDIDRLNGARKPAPTFAISDDIALTRREEK